MRRACPSPLVRSKAPASAPASHLPRLSRCSHSCLNNPPCVRPSCLGAPALPHPRQTSVSPSACAVRLTARVAPQLAPAASCPHACNNLRLKKLARHTSQGSTGGVAGPPGGVTHRRSDAHERRAEEGYTGRAGHCTADGHWLGGGAASAGQEPRGSEGGWGWTGLGLEGRARRRGCHVAAAAGRWVRRRSGSRAAGACQALACAWLVAWCCPHAQPGLK